MWDPSGISVQCRETDSLSRLQCVVLGGEDGCREEGSSRPRGDWLCVTLASEISRLHPSRCLSELCLVPWPLSLFLWLTQLTQGPYQASAPLRGSGPSRRSGEKAPGSCPQRSSSDRRRKRSYYSSAEAIRLEALQKQPQLQPPCEVTTNEENLCCKNKKKLQCIRQREQVFTRKVCSPREQPQWNCNQVS